MDGRVPGVVAEACSRSASRWPGQRLEEHRPAPIRGCDLWAEGDGQLPAQEGSRCLDEGRVRAGRATGSCRGPPGVPERWLRRTDGAGGRWPGSARPTGPVGGRMATRPVAGRAAGRPPRRTGRRCREVVEDRPDRGAGAVGHLPVVGRWIPRRRSVRSSASTMWRGCGRPGRQAVGRRRIGRPGVGRVRRALSGVTSVPRRHGPVPVPSRPPR